VAAFVDSLDTVNESFAACIGTVTDVVAQSITVRVTGTNGATVLRVLGSSFPTAVRDASGALVVSVGEVGARPSLLGRHQG
jgi:hypothetical protein